MSKRTRYILFSITAMILFGIIVAACVGISRYSDTRKLLEAIEDEDVTKVEALLEDGVDPNRTDVRPSQFWTFLEHTPKRPLSTACKTGNLEIVELLIAHGATAEAIKGTDWSPLRACLFYFHPDDPQIVALLLEHGATEEDAEKADKESPIFAAAQMKPYAYDKTKANGTVFIGEYDETTAMGITEIVRLLLGERSMNITDDSGKTLLMVSAQSENLHLAEYLIEAGCDPSATDASGKTALDYAVEIENEELIALLSECTPQE